MPDRPFVALVDGAQAPLLPLDLPAGLKGQARERVARLQISDGIGLPVAQVELRPFAAKPHNTPWSHVILTDTDQVAAWRKRCEQAGSRCRAILPDYLSLPALPQVWTIATTGKTTTVRLGLEDGFSCEHDLAVQLLTKAAKPKAVFRLGGAQPALDQLLDQLAVPICTSAAELAANDLPAPEVLGHGELLFDLRQNPVAMFEQARAVLGAWRMPTLLALLGLGLWSASAMVSLRDFQARALATRVVTVAEVRKHFVPSGPVLDIRTQVSQTLAMRQGQMKDPSGQMLPLALFKSAARIMQGHPSTLITASFSAARGLMVSLVLPDFAKLDLLVTALETGGIAVQIIESSSAEEGGVNSILVLQAKGKGRG